MTPDLDDLAADIPDAETPTARQEITDKPLDDKIALAKDAIREALTHYDPERCVIGFTGGKDSTAVAHLVKTVCEEEQIAKPRFMFVDHGQHFQEIEEFVERIASDWGFEAVTVRNDDLIDKADEPGDEVPVNDLNERNQQEVERLSEEYDNVPWLMDTEAGNHLLKTVPMNEFIEQEDIRAVINGVRWDEQEARSDETFFSPRQDPAHMRVHPILPFTERNIWELTWDHIIPSELDGLELEDWPHNKADLPDGVAAADLPISPKYWEGFRSLGSEVSTDSSGNDPAWIQDLDNTVERAGRAQDKEHIMKKLRDLGYM